MSDIVAGCSLSSALPSVPDSSLSSSSSIATSLPSPSSAATVLSSIGQSQKLFVSLPASGASMFLASSSSSSAALLSSIARNLETAQNIHLPLIQNFSFHAVPFPSSSSSSSSTSALGSCAFSLPSSSALSLTSSSLLLSTSLSTIATSLASSQEGSFSVSSPQDSRKQQSVINLSLPKAEKIQQSSVQDLQVSKQQQQQQHSSRVLQKRKRTAPTRYPMDMGSETRVGSESVTSSSQSSISSYAVSTPFPFAPSSSSSSPSSSASSMATIPNNAGLNPQQLPSISDVAMDDDDDNDDEQDKFLSKNYDPERLKAFNMFVRLFVDENLDRVAPISKQPKEKIQAIIEACDRQFPEFKSRSRKRIRTYLKSCRRIKKTKGACDDLKQVKSTMPHLTSAAAEAILAQACENESNNAKRMRIGLEPLTAEQMQASCLLGSNSQQLLSSTIQSTVSHTRIPPMAHSTYCMPCNYSTCKTLETGNQIMPSGNHYKATSSSTTDELLAVQKIETDMEDQQATVLKVESMCDLLQTNSRQPPSAHRSPVNDRSRETLHYVMTNTITPTSVFPVSGQNNSLYSFTNISFPSSTLGSQSLTKDVSADKSRQAMFGSSGVICVSHVHQQHQQQSIPLASHSCQHFSEAFGMDQNQLVPTDLSMKTQRRHQQTSQFSYPPSMANSTSIMQNPFHTSQTIRIRLTPDEIATIKQLIVGYRESAAFLYRSAEELQQLINTNSNHHI